MSFDVENEYTTDISKNTGQFRSASWGLDGGGQKQYSLFRSKLILPEGEGPTSRSKL